MQDRVALSKSLWIQSKTSHNIPSWNLNDCLYFLSLSDSTKRNLPGHSKLKDVKDAVGRRIADIIQDLPNSIVLAENPLKENNRNNSHQNLDYPLLVDTLNNLIFVMRQGNLCSLPLLPIQATSVFTTEQSICGLHDQLLQEPIVQRINQEKILQNIRQSNETVVTKLLERLSTVQGEVPKTEKQSVTTAIGYPMTVSSLCVMISPTTTTTMTNLAFDCNFKLQDYQHELASMADIDTKWNFAECISYLLLSEPYQHKLLHSTKRPGFESTSTITTGHPKNLCQLKLRVIARIHTLLQEKFAAIQGKQQDRENFLTIVVNTLNMLVESIRASFPMCPISSCSALTAQSLFSSSDLMQFHATASPASLQTLNFQASETMKIIASFQRNTLLARFHITQ